MPTLKNTKHSGGAAHKKHLSISNFACHFVGGSALEICGGAGLAKVPHKFTLTCDHTQYRAWAALVDYNDWRTSIIFYVFFFCYSVFYLEILDL